LKTEQWERDHWRLRVWQPNSGKCFWKSD